MMQAPPDAQIVRTFLSRVSRRRDVLALLEGAAGGLVAAAVILIVLLARESDARHMFWLAAPCAAVGAVVRLLHARSQHPSTAQLVEARVPACANAVRTASELLEESPLTVSPRASRLVFFEAAQRVQRISLAELIPLRWAAMALATSGVLWALIIVRDASPIRSARSALLSVVAPNVVQIDEIIITVTPPAYTNRSAFVLPDSSRIDALAGSRITLDVQARADSLRVESIDGVQVIAPVSEGQFVVSQTVKSDGLIALQPMLNGGADGPRRLFGIAVRDDEAPRVRIVQPTRDVRLNTPDTRLDITVSAEDDMAIASLRLRYTKVSGSGERFTFDEGEIPIRIARVSASQWTGQAQWPLTPLNLEPGDLVVYRAVTTDNRPGSPPQESDALIAELLAIGGEAAAGFDMDEEFERYAVSQAMVVLKTERLVAAMASMSRDSIAAAAQSLSVEQRKVRAEFVFMMGGELADEHGHEGDLDDLGEEAEAEAEGDILAGRLENQGRIALMRAVRSMSRASTALNAVEVSLALVSEKQALSDIQLAFSRSRILLRALSQRESLDLTRRLSGDLSDARSVQRATVLAELDSQTVSLQYILTRVATLAGSDVPPEGSATMLSALAQQLLQEHATHDAARDVASMLSDASLSMSRGESAQARASSERAALALARMVREQLPQPVQGSAPVGLRRLEGALADVLRERRAVQGRQ